MMLANRRRLWHAPIRMVPGLILLLLACGVRPGADPRAPVPEASRRLSYEIPRDSAGLDNVFNEAMEGAVCLIRTEKVPECQQPEQEPPPCNTLSPEQLGERLTGFFERLRRIDLRPSLRLNALIRDSIVNAIPTSAVDDARRRLPCGDWGGSDGPCLAIQYDLLWVLLTGDSFAGGDRRFNRMEIFLRERTCAANP